MGGRVLPPVLASLGKMALGVFLGIGQSMQSSLVVHWPSLTWPLALLLTRFT